MLALLIGLGVAASLTVVVVGARLGPFAVAPLLPASPEPTEPPRPTASPTACALAAQLQAEGLPVLRVWYKPGFYGCIVFVSRPLTEAQLQFLEEVVPRPWTLWREYGPATYPCSDNPVGPIRLWSGWSTGTLYGTPDRPPTDGAADLYLYLRRTWPDQLQGKLGLHGFAWHEQARLVGPDGQPHQVWLVGSQGTTLSPDDLELLRAIFPPNSPIEVWARISNTLPRPTLPPYVEILCGETPYP
jgi:hypothetical protein